MSFFAFIAQYYAERLHYYKGLDLAHCPEAALLDIAGEASALHKYLTDIVEEGYTITVNRLVRQTDALNRLQRFLSTVLAHLGGPSARERFYLFPDLIPLPQLTTETFAGGATFELQAYLDRLDHLSDDPVDIGHCTLLRRCATVSALASQNSGADDGNGCLSALGVSTTRPASPGGACAVAPRYAHGSFRTFLATPP